MYSGFKSRVRPPLLCDCDLGPGAHVNWVSVTKCHVLSLGSSNADKRDRGCGQVVL